jgi:hypothetical protein
MQPNRTRAILDTDSRMRPKGKYDIRDRDSYVNAAERNRRPSQMQPKRTEVLMDTERQMQPKGTVVLMDTDSQMQPKRTEVLMDTDSQMQTKRTVVLMDTDSQMQPKRT